MPEETPLLSLADQIYSMFLNELEADCADSKLVAAALRGCSADGVIGDRTEILIAVKAAFREVASDET